MERVDFSPRLKALRSIMNVGDNLSPEVRSAFQASFFSSELSILGGGFNAAAVAVLGYIRTDEPILLIMAIIDCLTVAVRVAGIRKARAGRWAPDVVLLGGLVWAISQATATTLIFQSGDLLLILVTSVSTVGAAAGVAARNFGAPRYALMQMLILDFCFKLNLVFFTLNNLAIFAFIQGSLFLVANMGLIRGLRGLTIRALEGEAASRALSVLDPLTGLSNRRGLEVAYAIGGVDLVAMIIDLDGFKAVNDRHGHAAGDIILVSVAARLRESCVGARSLCRLGGDEFVVLAEKVSRDDSECLARRLVKALSLPYRIDENQLATVGVSIGVARDNGSLSDLMEQADRALYAAKRSGKGKFISYEMIRSAAQTSTCNDGLRSNFACGRA